MVNDNEKFSASYPFNQRSVQKVKEMDPDQQPREKAEKYGIDTLSVPELWAIILRTGTPGYPVTELCRDLMKQNDSSLHKLERRTRPELMEHKGIGLTKCIQIQAVMQLIKKYCAEKIDDKEPIRQSQQIFERMHPLIGNLDHEEIWMLILNRRNQVVKEIKMTPGTSTSSLFDVKSAIKHALLENAESVILCHNHPSNSLKSSPQDDRITQDLKEACDYMKIKLLDHLIITDTGFFSYRDKMKL